ncbi:MAG: ribose 5-phosphate isomerase B [Alphaproteobacteria bacterium]|nr:ribose 5-phosphate isomerase B [Alphaproteobacteria bacterium]
MPTVTVAVANDHAGLPLKALVLDEIRGLGFVPLDLGTNDGASVDYPDFGRAAASAVASGRAQRAVIICGTGIGISMAANRHAGVRAAVCHDSSTARLARQHNDANVLALGARIIGPEVARDCVRTFLTTDFEGGRHGPRVAKLA